MTNNDFDYSDYANETLYYAIDAARANIKEYKQSMKSLNKKLNAPKGYSKKKIEVFEYRYLTAERMITSLTKEIIECQEELAKREAEVYFQLDSMGRSLQQLNDDSEEINADPTIPSESKSEMLWANQVEKAKRCELIAQLRSVQGR
jgi:chromosome segregation ATPase